MKLISRAFLGFLLFVIACDAEQLWESHETARSDHIFLNGKMLLQTHQTWLEDDCATKKDVALNLDFQFNVAGSYIVVLYLINKTCSECSSTAEPVGEVTHWTYFVTSEDLPYKVTQVLQNTTFPNYAQVIYINEDDPLYEWKKLSY